MEPTLYDIGLQKEDGTIINQKIKAKNFHEALMTLLRLVNLNRDGKVEAIALKKA